MAAQKKAASLVPALIGIVLIILGCVLGFVVFPNLLEEEVEHNVVLKEDTLQWYRFRDIPFPINFKVYFFTIENPVETMAGQKPIVKEVGPYVWSEKRVKVFRSVEKNSIVYDELWSFKFNASASGSLSEEDRLVVLNSPVIAILQSLEDLPIPLPVQLILGEILQQPGIFESYRVADYAFEGIKMCDPIRTQHPLSMLVCLSMMLMRLKVLQYNADGSMMFSLFGYKRLADGPFTLDRGINDISRLGLITKYKGQEYTNIWGENLDGSRTCDLVEGHYTTFPPFMEEGDQWRVYSSDLCKGGVLHYGGETTFKDVDAIRFQTDEFSFATPGENCVCINKTKGLDGNQHCFNQSLVDLYNCLGVPVVLSFPHLMFAYDDITSSIDGMDSNYTDDHNTIIDFQPHLGFPLRGAIRIQLNQIFREMKSAPFTQGFKSAVFPLMWLEDSFELTDALIEEINDQLLSKLVLMDAVQWTLIAIGILLIVASIVALICCSRKRSA